MVRRQFLADIGLRFAPGWYEDVSFSYPLLLAADRIGVLDVVCVQLPAAPRGGDHQDPG